MTPGTAAMGSVASVAREAGAVAAVSPHRAVRRRRGELPEVELRHLRRESSVTPRHPRRHLHRVDGERVRLGQVARGTEGQEPSSKQGGTLLGIQLLWWLLTRLGGNQNSVTIRILLT